MQDLNIGEHIQDALAQCTPVLNRCCPALFGVDQQDRPELFASAVAISVDGKSFLVTAAHAVWEIQRYGSLAYVGGKSIRPIGKPFCISSHDGNDPVDLALVQVSPEFLNTIGIEPIGDAQLCQQGRFQNAHMRCIHGFPASRNKTVPSVDEVRRVFQMRSFIYAGVQDSAARLMVNGREPSTHIALSYHKKSRNERGEKSRPPQSPKGMSGGGLWVIPNSFEPSNIFLEGISIEHHGDLVLATRSEMVVAMVANGA